MFECFDVYCDWVALAVAEDCSYSADCWLYEGEAEAVEAVASGCVEASAVDAVVVDYG